jgi:tRNA dimethylallyltransferase
MKKIIVIVGPNAVGKSALAITLARKFNGEIISTDSRQVYRGLNIGTGKVTKKEMRGVTHHLLDVADPKKQFNVSDYVKIARKNLEEIFSRNHIPIICGGTGLYIDALLGNISIPEIPPNPKLRKELEHKSLEELFEILKNLAPERAQNIDKNNPRRLIRAIEITTAASRTQKILPALPIQKWAPTRLKIFWCALRLPESKLKKKIAARLRARLKRGMISEVKKLHARGLSWKRMEELGLEYRYISRYLRGLITKDEMIEKLQSESWYYAKRQYTWFKKNKNIRWFNPNQKKEIFFYLRAF